VNDAACDGIDACASADSSDPSDTGSSKPAPDAGSGSADECPQNAKGCATRDNEICSVYAKAGHPRALACCGGTDPTQGVGGLDCEGPIVNGTDTTYWCCK
jgi:hypothetical protein